MPELDTARQTGAVPEIARIPGTEECSVTLDGVRWRYLHAGSGPPLLLLHGFMACLLYTSQTRMFQMNVGVVEARHYEVAAEINNVRVGAFQPADLVVRPHGKNAALA